MPKDNVVSLLRATMLEFDGVPRWHRSETRPVEAALHQLTRARDAFRASEESIPATDAHGAICHRSGLAAIEAAIRALSPEGQP